MSSKAWHWSAVGSAGIGLNNVPEASMVKSAKAGNVQCRPNESASKKLLTSRAEANRYSGSRCCNFSWSDSVWPQLGCVQSNWFRSSRN